MKSITLTKKQFDKLNMLDIGDASHYESDIYVLNHGPWKYADGSLLFKKLKPFCERDLATKLQTACLMIENEKEINSEELVIPNSLVVIKDKVEGFTVPYVKDARTLRETLKDDNISNSEKIEYLKKVGKTLKKIDSLKRRKIINLSIGDLHEDNVLVTKDGKIKLIDLDSAYIENNYPQGARYLRSDGISKCKKYKANVYGIVYPNKTSDLYCYIIMILNMLSKEHRMDRKSIPEYFDYLNYLKYLGFGEDLLKAFGRVYTEGPNINPVDYLDEINTENIDEASYENFEKKYIKK